MPRGATTPYPWKCSVQIYGGAILPPGSQKTSGTALDKCWKFQMWGWFFAAVAGGPTSGRSFGLLGRLAACIRRGGAPPTWRKRLGLTTGLDFCRCCGRPDLGAKLWPFGQACSLHSPRGRASYMGKAVCSRGGWVSAAVVGGPTSGRSFGLLGRLAACIRRGGAPPTLGKAARFDYGVGFLPLLWEARPWGERLEVGAGLWPAFAAGRASHIGESGSV